MSASGRACFLAALPLLLTGWAARSEEVPVLVELFTAEGCSSCPPADRFLAQLDTEQPVRGARLIVLSEHVDYWDGQGWPDPYASKKFTERQRAYERSLKVSEPFTPQFILDGTIDMRLTRPKLVNGQLLAAAARAKPSLRIESLRLDAGAPPMLRGVVDVPPLATSRPCDLLVGVALDHADTQVLRGENRGQHLRHVAVLRALERVASVPSGAASEQSFSIALDAGVENQPLRIIAFVQQADLGAVLAVAEQTRSP